jgi:hypothetical protein
MRLSCKCQSIDGFNYQTELNPSPKFPRIKWKFTCRRKKSSKCSQARRGIAGFVHDGLWRIGPNHRRDRFISSTGRTWSTNLHRPQALIDMHHLIKPFVHNFLFRSGGTFMMIRYSLLLSCQSKGYNFYI